MSYSVPALEKAHLIFNILLNSEVELTMTDIINKTEINKSTVYSILHVLTELSYLEKTNKQTYVLGPQLGILGSKYLRQFNITSTFNDLALQSVNKIGATCQLAILNGLNIIYLSKIDASSQIHLVTSPGMTLPAHATAMGKVLLSQYSDTEIEQLYTGYSFTKLTDKTIDSIPKLLKQLHIIQQQGWIQEIGEAVEIFTCISSPIFNNQNKIIAATSFTHPINGFDPKKNLIINETINLAKQISSKAGYSENL